MVVIWWWCWCCYRAMMMIWSVMALVMLMMSSSPGPPAAAIPNQKCWCYDDDIVCDGTGPAIPNQIFATGFKAPNHHSLLSCSSSPSSSSWQWSMVIRIALMITIIQIGTCTRPVCHHFWNVMASLANSTLRAREQTVLIHQPTWRPRPKWLKLLYPGVLQYCSLFHSRQNCWKGKVSQMEGCQRGEFLIGRRKHTKY